MGVQGNMPTNGGDGARDSAESGGPLSWNRPFMVASVGGTALLLVGAAVALAVGAHRKKQRRQYECLPYSNQNQVFTYTTVSPPERKLSSVSIRSNESVCIYATAATPDGNNPAERPIDFVVPPMLSPGSAMEDRLLTPLGDNVPLGERLSISGVSGEKAALLASAAQLFGGLNPELYREERDSDEFDFPNGHLGRIWFGLDYDAPAERLLVKIMKCRNLPSRTLGQVNCCDPFIRIYLMPDERRYLQTKFKKKTCNPVFDETYVFQIPARHIDERVLKLSVVDNERGKHHNVIGHAFFPLSQLDWACGENTLVTWKDLDKHAAQLESSDGRRGELHVGLAFHSNQERLTVTVMETREMPDNLTGEFHVKVCLQLENKVIKSKKSNPHRAAPGVQVKFMESLVFKVKPNQIGNVSVIIKAVSDSHKDTQLGRIILGSFMFARGKALQHWTDAMTNAPKQVQEWHRFT